MNITSMKVIRTTIFEAPSLAEKIRDARWEAKKRGKSLKDICEEVGMTQSNWYLIEKGITKELSEDTVIKIEKALDVDLGINFKQPIAA